MKNFKIFFTILGVAFLVACGGANQSSKKSPDKEQDTEKIVEKPKDSLTLAAERRAEQAAIDKKWMENDQKKIGDLFDEWGMTSKQINRFVIESRNNNNAWKEENPDEIMTMFDKRAIRDRTMHNILDPTQMNEYLKWTQEIDSKD